MKNLSVIIPTRNRPQYLYRLLKYFELQKFNPTIIIADSSDEENALEVQKVVKLLKNSAIILEQYEKNILFYEKVYKASLLVQTDLVTLCADDDFLISKGVIESCNFLNEHDDYGVARGLSYVFYYSNQELCWLPVHHVNSVDQETPTERIASSGLLSLCFYYSVHRIELLQEKFKIASQSMPHLNWISNQIIEAFPAIYGKIKVLNVPYHLQEKSDTTTGACLYTLNQDTLHTKNFHQEYATLVYQLFIFLSKYSTEPYQKLYKEAKAFVSRVVDELISIQTGYVDSRKPSLKEEIQIRLRSVFQKLKLTDSEYDKFMTLYTKVLLSEKQALADFQLVLQQSNLFSSFDGGGMIWKKLSL